jgi:ABC-type lipoprotein export system ATPase subunit
VTKLSDLKKLTAVKLREMADEFEEIVGASGMTKDALVHAIAAALKKRDRFQDEVIHSMDIDKLEADRMKFRAEMKVLIKQKKTLLAAEQHDHEKIKEVRSSIKRLRRRIHRVHNREVQVKKLMKIK